MNDFEFDLGRAYENISHNKKNTGHIIKHFWNDHTFSLDDFSNADHFNRIGKTRSVFSKKGGS
jgi:hypothetical protein